MQYQQQDFFHLSEQEDQHFLISLPQQNQIIFESAQNYLGKQELPKNIKKQNLRDEVEGKTKPIQKQKKNSDKKYTKRKKDESISVKNGRPDNCITEGPHLKENKSYNDIVYHLSRFLIFLKFKQGKQQVNHKLELTQTQNQLINKFEPIMSQDNFPAFQAQKPYFLLHPNSPHFVFDCLKKNEEKFFYSSQEVQYLMIAYLLRKGLLTSTIYKYLCEYWKDIVYLVNYPKGEDNLPNKTPQDCEPDLGQLQEMQSSPQNNQNKNLKGSQKEQTISETIMLQNELKEDDSIAAYEIACYLHACCQKYSIKINP